MAISSVGSFTSRKRVRKTFGRITEVAPMFRRSASRTCDV